MSLPQKAALKPAAPSGTGAVGPPPPAVPPPTASSAAIRGLQPPPISRGALQQGLDDRIFTPSAVSAVYSTVAAQVARQPGPQAPSPYSSHDLTKGLPNLAVTPPGHASSPGLSQLYYPVYLPVRKYYDPNTQCLSKTQASYASGQNAAAPTLVYQQPPQTMSTQPQNRSPFAAGPRPTHHQGGFRPIQFFQRPQIQPPRTAIQNNNPSIRPGAQTATAVYQTNQPIMMVNHLPMPYAMPQGPQYCIPQYRHSAPPYVGPPQQYPVQPPGPSPFYPGPGPGEFTNPYGTPFYPSQPVYQSAPIIVPTQQQPPPPAKREKKTIRIRDPNQGGKDITEEIMSGGSRNPTPPILRPSSTPTPPQLPSQAPEHSTGVFGTMESPHLTASIPAIAAIHPKSEEKPKQDLVLKSSPPPCLQAESSAMEKSIDSETVPLDTSPERPQTTSLLPLVATTPLAVPTAPAFPCHLEDTSEGDESPPATEILPEEAAADEMEDELCKDPLGLPVPTEVQVIAQEINGINYEKNTLDNTPGEKVLLGDVVVPEVPELVPSSPSDTDVECTSSSNVPLSSQALSVSSQPESPPPPLIAPAALCTTKSSPPATILPPPSQGHLEEQEEVRTSIVDGAGDLTNKGRLEAESELEHNVQLLTVASRKSPVEVHTVATAPKMWQKPKDGSPDIEAMSQPEEEPQDEDTEEEKPLEVEQDQITGNGAATECPFIASTKPLEENGEAEPVRNGTDGGLECEDVDVPPVAEDGVVFPYKSGGGPTEKPAESVMDPSPLPAPSEQPEGKRQYDRDFLLGFQYMPACILKPEGLPPISDVVLDKINQPKIPLRTLDTRMLPRGPDFTPAYADFGRPAPGGRGGVPLLNVGPRRSQPGQRGGPRKIIMNISVTDDVHLKKSENAWKPSVKRDSMAEDPENIRTQALFRKVRSILNKLTPQMFHQLMKQVTDLTVDTEERLKGVIDLVFEKAIDEPSFSVAYANMCRCLATLKVPMADKPGSWVNFRKILLNRCQKEFEKDKADDDVFEKKQKELELAKTPEEKTKLQDELEEAKDKARRRSIGNIKFIGELFKLKMLTEAIMHDCVVKLLKNHDEESLECLCRLLTTIGKDLDFEKAKPRMDQYFHQMEKIVKERKTSSRIRFMLQDVIDVRMCNWVSRRADQGPKTIEQIHKEAKIEEQEEQRKVQQLMTKDKRRPAGVQRVDEGGWNTVQGAKNNRVIDPSKFLKITKPTIDEKIQLVPKAQPGSWGKGSSGGAKASDTESLRPGAPGLNRFSALQQSPSPTSSPTSAEQDPRRNLASREKNDKPTGPTAVSSAARPSSFIRGSGSKELINNQEELRRETLQTVKQLMSSTEVEKTTGLERKLKGKAESPEAEKSETRDPDKLSLSEEEMERKSKAIIDEFLHINDYKEAMQCVEELRTLGALPVFVRVGVESTLERSQITRDHMGQLLYQLVQSGKLSKQDFFTGFSDTLELADDMAIDIPHIWLYLAELVTPMLKEGGISLKELILEFGKALQPVGRGGVLLSEILHLLCKQMSHKKVAALWRETGLKWKDFLPEGEDVQSFVSEKNLDFTLSDSSSSENLSKKEMSAEELNKRLEQLILQEKANDEQIFDWVEANLDECQMSSPTFLRALMTAICKAAILGDCSSCRVDTTFLKQRVPVLLKYLDSDTERELQALYALQALIVILDQPPNLLRMFFDCLYDEEVISEDAFYKWESSKDPAEQNGKGVALKSVTAFFTWLREAEEESEDN
ncbi:eukaryotic translation initiation factor 4 gamma 3 isoform X8 [Pelobates fuscus]|uniref:eukaryotic translation initiation factor 4 gamma 3 isoform X8 n=1 Tax=Pelobates fuscus TaxID=191477 RepID=UPI002FE49E87